MGKRIPSGKARDFSGVDDSKGSERIVGHFNTQGDNSMRRRESPRRTETRQHLGYPKGYGKANGLSTPI